MSRRAGPPDEIASVSSSEPSVRPANPGDPRPDLGHALGLGIDTSNLLFIVSEIFTLVFSVYQLWYGQHRRQIVLPTLAMSAAVVWFKFHASKETVRRGHLLLILGGGYMSMKWFGRSWGDGQDVITVLSNMFVSPIAQMWSADLLLVVVVYIAFVRYEGPKYQLSKNWINIHTALGLLWMPVIGVPVLLWQIHDFKLKRLEAGTVRFLVVWVLIFQFLHPYLLVRAWSGNLSQCRCTVPPMARDANFTAAFAADSIIVLFAVTLLWALRRCTDFVGEDRLKLVILAWMHVNLNGFHVGLYMAVQLLTLNLLPANVPSEKGYAAVFRLHQAVFLGINFLFYGYMSILYPGVPWHNGDDCYADDNGTWVRPPPLFTGRECN